MAPGCSPGAMAGHRRMAGKGDTNTGRSAMPGEQQSAYEAPLHVAGEARWADITKHFMLFDVQQRAMKCTVRIT